MRTSSLAASTAKTSSPSSRIMPWSRWRRSTTCVLSTARVRTVTSRRIVAAARAIARAHFDAGAHATRTRAFSSSSSTVEQIRDIHIGSFSGSSVWHRRPRLLGVPRTRISTSFQPRAVVPLQFLEERTGVTIAFLCFPARPDTAMLPMMKMLPMKMVAMKMVVVMAVVVVIAPG